MSNVDKVGKRSSNYMEKLFQKLVNNPKLKPYGYQQRVYKAISQKENIILRAPTGAGKTLAILLPYLKSFIYNSPFCDRVIYALPLRSLANNLYKSTEEMVSRVINLTDKPTIDLFDNDTLSITLQTGQCPNDPLFQGDIIFTTVDQLLSSYLNIPYSVPAKLANINCGALIGSLIVFDEFHLLDPQASLKSVYEMIKRLENLSQFVLMTATMTDESIKLLNKSLKAKIIEVKNEEIKHMPNHTNKERRIKWMGCQLTAEQILNTYNGQSILVICNTVKKAQNIYKGLKKLLPVDCELYLLHSRYLAHDREFRENWLRENLGPQLKGKPEKKVLVTTQVVEAGIDISVDEIHTEICHANSLIQRAGRCARYGVPRNKGFVFVYDLENNEDGKVSYLPYKKELLEATKRILLGLNEAFLNLDLENQLVAEVHGREEKDVFLGLQRSEQTLSKVVMETVYHNDRSKSDQLIRDIDSISIIITDKPEEIDFNSMPPIFSLSKTSLYQLKEQVENSEEKLFWKLTFPNRGEIPIWEACKTLNDSHSSWLLALSPKLASYSDVGLELGVAGKSILEPKAIPKVPIIYEYNWEPYKEHVELVVALGQKFFRRNEQAVQAIKQYYEFQQNFLYHFIQITLVLHDTGKLLNKWQQAAIGWQQDHYPEAMERVGPVAHVTYRQGDFNKQRAKKYDRGNHAWEGAHATWPLILEFLKRNLPQVSIDELGVLGRVVSSAIGNHHTSNFNSINQIIEFTLIKDANKLVAETVNFLKNDYNVKLSSAEKNLPIRNYVLRLDELDEYFALYMFLIRVLRLCDQAATAKGGSNN
jgi:CRISPR-associated endonuclease/helicase Cas3